MCCCSSGADNFAWCSLHGQQVWLWHLTAGRRAAAGRTLCTAHQQPAAGLPQVVVVPWVNAAVQQFARLQAVPALRCSAMGDTCPACVVQHAAATGSMWL
jgi:hypothetical protein